MFVVCNLQQSKPNVVCKYDKYHNKFIFQNKLLVRKNVLERNLDTKEKFANKNCNIFKESSIDSSCTIIWRDIEYLETTLNNINDCLLGSMIFKLEVKN